MAKFFHNNWLVDRAKVIYGGATPPPANSFYYCLADSNTLTRSSPKAAFFAAEISGDGYARAAIAINPANIAYSNVNQRVEMGIWDATFPQFSVAKQWQTGFMIAGGVATPSVSINDTNINPSADTISLTNSWANAQEVTIEALPGATLPSPLVANTVYTILNRTANSFQLSSDGVTQTNITAAGSGGFLIRNITGQIVMLDARGQIELWQPNRTYAADLEIVEFNDVYGNGV
jgi:hypothetical protein